MTILDKYPNAYEDDRGTIWVNQQAAESADWSFGFGDAFLDNILGWSWQDALDNFDECQRRDDRRAFWTSHPRLRSLLWFLTRWSRALWMFSRIVWRDWYGRISWSTAWEISRDLWLR